jgi:hypothetical protein
MFGALKRRLPITRFLPLAILFDLLKLVLYDNALVDQPLEILIVRVEQWELDIIDESLQEHVLLLFVDVEFIWCIPQ